jgi:hypothetical protein
MSAASGRTGTTKASGTSSRRTVLVLAAVALLAAGAAGGYLLGRSADTVTEPDPGTSAEAPVPTPEPGDDTPVPPITDGAPPTSPAPVDSALTTISTPPDSTLAMIDPSKLDADARYSIRFSPFGYGPPQGGGTTLVIRVEEAILETEGAMAMDFTDRNLLAIVDPAEPRVTEGGTYTATLTFQEEGGLLLPVLGGIAVAE